MRNEVNGTTGPTKPLTVGGVTLYLQPPDEIPDGFAYLDFENLVPRIVDAIRENGPDSPPMSVCLTGPPGVGKNAIAWAVAKMLGKSCWTTQGCPDATAQDLVVFPVPTDLQRFDPVASGLCTAFLEGGIGLFDEAGKVAKYAPEALTPLASMLDDRRLLWSDYLKTMLRPGPGFACIMTKQSDETLPDYLTSRMLTFRLSPPPPDVLMNILRTRAPSAPDLLLAAFRDWASARTNLVPRDAGLIVHYAHRMAGLSGAKTLTAREADRLVRLAAEAVMGGGART